MSSTQPITPPPTRQWRPMTAARRWWWRHPVVLSVLMVVLASCVVSLWNRVDDSWDRQALRAVEVAAEDVDKPIGVISESVADRWSATSGPPERVVASSVGPGNGYLEPMYYAYHDRYDDSMYVDENSDRCYYLAVQPGTTFDAEKVSGLVRICYLDPYKTPQSSGFISVVD